MPRTITAFVILFFCAVLTERLFAKTGEEDGRSVPLRSAASPGAPPAATASAAQDAQSLALSYVQQGEKYYQAERYSEALREFRRAVEIDPGFLKGWENLGHAHWKLNNIDETIRVWENILSITPDDTRIMNLLARAYASRNSLDKALTLYEQSLRLMPDQKEARQSRARLLYDLNRAAEAVNELERLVDEHPQDVPILHLYVRSAARLGRVGEAVHSIAGLNVVPFRWVLRTWALEYIEKGRDEYRASRFREAASHFRTAVALDPSLIPGWKNLSWASLKLGQAREAVEILETLRTLAPDDPRILNTLARAYTERDDVRKALDLYETSIKMSPDNRDARLNRARLLLTMNRRREALREFRALVRAYPEDVQVRYQFVTSSATREAVEESFTFMTTLNSLVFRWLLRGEAMRYIKAGEEHYRSERFEKAAGAFRKATLLDPGFFGGWRNLGWALWKAGKVDATIGIWERLRAGNPDDIRLLSMLARAYASKEQFQKALSLYDGIIKLEPGHRDARFHRARIFSWSKDFSRAISEMEILVRDFPEDVEVRAQLARFLSDAGRHKEATVQWGYVCRMAPSEIKYRIQLAKSLYAGDRTDEGMRIVEDILRRDPQNTRAMELAARDALHGREWERAAALFTRIADLEPADTGALKQVVRLSFKMGDYDAVIDAAQKSLKINPEQADILSYLGDASRLRGKYSQAEEAYERLLSVSSNSLPARMGLKELYTEQRKYAAAVKQVDLLLKTDPTNVYHLHDKAEILAYQGKHDAAVKILRRILAERRDSPMILVLLYHGLTSRTRSDILQVANFKDHLLALQDLGHTAISMEDLVLGLEGKKSLPEKSFIITFDDARRDSFQFADPVLEELGMKATMFVPISIIDKKNPFFCDWPEIRKYNDTGRWDIQAHGDFSHERIMAGPNGEMRHFLGNKMWLDPPGRLETDEEFRDRVHRDYESCREKLSKIVANPVAVFSYPEGNLGQEDLSNHAGALRENLAGVAGPYRAAFVQNRYGFNFAGDTPHLLKRIEIPSEWTREALEEHVRSQNPLFKTRVILADVLRWAGDHDEALKLYQALEKEHPASERVLLGKAALFLSTGNYDDAEAVLDDFLRQYPGDKRALEQKRLLDRAMSPAFMPSFLYFKDSNDRETTRWKGAFDVPIKGNFVIQPAYAYAIMKEEGFEDVEEHSPGVSVAYRDQLRLFKGSYSFREFSGDAETANNYRLSADFPLFALDRIGLVHGFESIETARAVQEDIQLFRSGILFDQGLPWDFLLSGRYEYLDYTDDNQRHSARGGLHRLFLKKPTNLWLGYEFTFDDTRFDAPAYYAPQELKIHYAKIRVRDKIFDKRFSYDLSYARGYASEDLIEDRWVNAAQVLLAYDVFDAFSIFASYNLGKSPTYQGETVQAGMIIRF